LSICPEKRAIVKVKMALLDERTPRKYKKTQNQKSRPHCGNQGRTSKGLPVDNDKAEVFLLYEKEAGASMRRKRGVWGQNKPDISSGKWRRKIPLPKGGNVRFWS